MNENISDPFYYFKTMKFLLYFSKLVNNFL